MSQSKFSGNKLDERNTGVVVVRPRARTEGIVVRELTDETLVYDLARHKAMCLNQTASLVWKSCDGQTDVARIAGRLRAELPGPDVLREGVVWLALEMLGRENLLQERVKRPTPAAPSATTSSNTTHPPHTARTTTGMSRRDLMRVLGVAAAVSLPLVTAIVAPTVAQAAASCIPAGGGCTSSVQCCAGTCDNGIGGSNVCVG